MTIIYHDEPEGAPTPFAKNQEADASRETIIKRFSDSIRGSYDLLDLVDLSTSSGSIDVSVTPGQAKGSPTASFNASTSSGSVKAVFPTSIARVPQRDNRTTIETSSGSIRGNYILGSRSSFRSQSGGINIMLLAVDESCGAELATNGASGRQDIQILAGNNGSLDNVSISSESTSGSIALRVPFEGSIKAKSHSGSIIVEGKGVTIEKDIQSGSQKVVEARKGKGKGRIDLSTTSGSIKIFVA